MKTTTLCAAFGVLCAGCATPPDAVEAGGVYDPYENWNRRVFAFNEAVDKAAFEPAAKVYRYATPAVARQGVRNVLSNLNAPVVFVNDVLQGEADRAGTTFSRFAVNTVFGIGGIFDVASASGLEGHSEDFGQTLGVWGVDSGPFLVVPLLGPSTPRDLFGTGVDRAFDPLTWTQFEDDDTQTTVAITRGTLGFLSAREGLIEVFDQIREQPEPYIAYRRGYISQREAAIRNGRDDPDAYKDLPDFDDFSDFEDFEDTDE
ncbi:MAG: VacJ family lipoprotein [Pseudomonadota bacterium]